MTPEQRKKLEEMSFNQQVYDRRDDLHRRATLSEAECFRAGAEAAWALATQAERERCAERADKKLQSIMVGNYTFLVESYRSQISEAILNPPAEGKSE